MVRAIVFAINEPGAISLEKIIEAGVRVDLLISKQVGDRSYTKPYEIAEKLNIPVLFPTTFDDPSMTRIIKELSPDILISSWFHLKIPRKIIECAGKAAINFHPSLLPKYRGATPVEWAIMNNEHETGLTCHLITDRFDEGDILWQEKIPIDGDCTTGELTLELARLVGHGMLDVCGRIKAGDFSGIPQNDGAASSFPKRTEGDAVINWSWPSLKIHNRIRAMNPRPLARTFAGDRIVYIRRSRLIGLKTDLAPGTIIDIPSADELYVACGGEETIAVRDFSSPDLPMDAILASGFNNGVINETARY